MMVDSYEFGRIVVNNKKYTSDIILGDRVINESWWRKEGHRVHEEDIVEILDYNPEVVVFGTGYHGVVKVEKRVLDLLKERGIEVEIYKSSTAVNRFNELKRAGKNVVLAIHLTC
jgi:hypothetical protein